MTARALGFFRVASFGGFRWLLIVAAWILASSARDGLAAESPPKLKPSWAEVCKLKPGTEYLNGMPKEIIWLKDGAEMVLVPGGEFLFGEEKEKQKGLG